MASGFTRSLTTDHTQVPSTQTDFPVLVSLSNSTLRSVAHGGHVQRADGFDIGFYTDTTLVTKLKWEMERYNPSSGEVIAWVKISSLSSASNNVFTMSYGDPTIITDQSDAVNTFSNSFLGVYHLKDGNTLSVLDSLNSNNGTNHGATAAGGQIDGGGGFVSASSQYIDLSTGIAPAAITYSAWVNATSFPNSLNTVIDRKNAANNSYSQLFVNSAGKLSVFCFGIADVSYNGTGSHTLSTATWYYLVMTYTNTGSAGLNAYVNASSDHVNVGSSSNLDSTSAPTYIANDTQTAGRFWNGILDECRVASVARSADWITCEYNNQQTGSTFLTLGAETVLGSVFSGLFTMSSAPTLVDSYSETNYDHNDFLDNNSLNNGALGQAFTATGVRIGSVKFYLAKSITTPPTGNAVVSLYATTGSFGTTAVPTGAALATSDVLNVSTIPTTDPTLSLVTFTFSGANQFLMTNGTHYAVMLEYTSGDSSHYVIFGDDTSSPSHAGNLCYHDSGGYHALSTTDACFYVYST